MDDVTNNKTDQTGTPSAIKEISLSQAILAPLDASFQAQVHGARSFLNMLLQIGYPHVKLDKDGNPIDDDKKDKPVYMQEFIYKDKDDSQMKISIPGLALVPITPISIDSAKFKLDFKVEKQDRYQQMQAHEENVNEEAKESSNAWNANNRPWYLIQDPVSFKGNVAPPADSKSESSQSSSSVISIEINLSRQPLPAGLDKLLTALHQSSHIQQINP